jgi:lipoprotein-anchoring transpeptidase ErfK/SrfK
MIVLKRLYALIAMFLSLITITPLVEARNRTSLPVPDPTLQIVIDISSQSMAVTSYNKRLGSYKVSTARAGYWTPRGRWRVQRMARVHWSKQYHAPLPHAIFFVGGIAIHATKGVHRLGTPASHGCVRLSPGDAARVYGLVAQHGMKKTLVTVTN